MKVPGTLIASMLLVSIAFATDKPNVDCSHE